MTAKTPEQISHELATLIALKPSVVEFSVFGDSNHAAIEAAIAVLAYRLTVDQIEQRFGHDKYLHLEALHAHDWMRGLLAEDDAPSEAGWPMVEVVA